jgi:hypothetical protein
MDDTFLIPQSIINTNAFTLINFQFLYDFNKNKKNRVLET